VAILSSLVAAVLLTCLGMSLVLLGSAATALSAHDAQGTAAAYEAQAAAMLAASEVRVRPDWSGVWSAGVPADVSAAPGRLADATFFPRAPWDGSSIDLHALTTARQAESDGALPPGVAGPVWRLFEYGPISRLVPSDPSGHARYVVVWVADGRGGVVLLHATAFGAAGVRASVEASVGLRPGAAAPSRLAIRSVP
jgi:hypothetical protein